MPAEETNPLDTLEIDLQKENIVSIVSRTSEIRGIHENKANEGVLIEGLYIGRIDIGEGTVAIAEGGVFVGSLRAGKLISDGHILRSREGEAAAGDARIDISGMVVLGPSSVCEVDAIYGELEVMRGARISARMEARGADRAAHELSRSHPAPVPVALTLNRAADRHADNELSAHDAAAPLQAEHA